MNNDWIYVEPRQPAVLNYDDESVFCYSVPEAWLHWAQLEPEQKARATIEAGDEVYGVFAIKRLRYGTASDAEMSDAA